MPKEFFGSWCSSSDTTSCLKYPCLPDFGLKKYDEKSLVGFGGYCGGEVFKIRKYPEFYVLDFIAHYESGETNNSSLLIFYDKGNLFIDNETPLKKSEAVIVYKYTASCDYK
jgi:hypothetical protein